MGLFSARCESGCATASGSSAVPVDRAAEHQPLHAGRAAKWSSFFTAPARRSMRLSWGEKGCTAAHPACRSLHMPQASGGGSARGVVARLASLSL